MSSEIDVVESCSQNVKCGALKNQCTNHKKSGRQPDSQIPYLSLHSCTHALILGHSSLSQPLLICLIYDSGGYLNDIGLNK